MQSNSEHDGARLPPHPSRYHEAVSTFAQPVKRKPLPVYRPISLNEDDQIHGSPLARPTHTQPQDAQLLPYHPKKPFWLHTWVVVSLASLFAIVFAMMFVVRQYSLSEQGFKLTFSDNHYAWTYGPTLIMVILVSLWRQVDYYCKSTIAWAMMDHGPASAQQTVLLDYLWPLQTTCLKRGILYRHTAVILSTVAFILLKIVVLASPGLLVLLSTDVLGPISVSMNTKFSGESFWGTVLRGDDAGGEQYPHPTNFTLYWDPGRMVYANVSTTPISTYVGDIERGAASNSSTQGDAVLQSFSFPSSIGSVKKVSAYVDAFVPINTCEIATVGYYLVEDYGVGLTFDSPTCSVGHQNRTDSSTGALFNQSWLPQSVCEGDGCGPYELIYFSFRVNCSDYSGNRGGATIDFTPSTEHQYNWAFVALNMTVEKISEESDASGGSNWTHTMTASSAVICKIDYQIANASLTYNLEDVTDETTSITYGEDKGQLADFSGQQLSEALIAGIMAWKNPAMAEESLNDIYSLRNMFELMSRTLNESGEASFVKFFDADLLKTKATEVLNGTASRFMQMIYMQPEDIQGTGVARIIEQRLHVGSPSFWTMTIALLITTFLALSTIFTTRYFKLPRDVDSVGGMAAILSSSHTLNAILHESGGCSRRHLKAGLNPLSFHTRFNQNAGIHVTGTTSRLIGPDLPQLQSLSKARWVPYAGRKHAVALTVCVPLLAIATLEILYQTSSKNDGVVGITNEKSATVYAIKYISTAVALLIATLYNTLDFTVATFAPFILLRAGAKPASRSIFVHTLGCLPPVAIYRSIRHRCGGPTFASIAAIIGSTLTIVVSGLWVQENSVQYQAAVTTTLATYWTSDWPDSVNNDNGATALFDRIQHGENDMPSNIWQDLVLPDINNITSLTQIDGANSSHQNYTLVVPALRPVLDCAVIPRAQRNISVASNQVMQYSAEYDLPSGCLTGPNANLSTLNFEGGTMVNGGSNPRVYVFSAFADIHMGPWDDDDGQAGEATNQTRRSDNPAGCPSIAIMFGRYNTTYSTIDDFAAFVCNQKLQVVPTQVTFIGEPANMIFDPQTPPSPDEASAVFVDNGTKGVEAFPFRLQAHLQTQLTQFARLSDFTYDLYSSFFDHLVFGPNGSYSSLYPDKTCNRCLGPFRDEENCCEGYPDIEALTAAIYRLYKAYMVIVIDKNLKRPLAESETANFVISGHTTTIQSRLAINFSSKLTLQICLAVMTILGISTFWLVDLQNTLPAPPTSIATTMSLLAGSELCDPSSGIMPRNAAYMDDKELMASLNGYIFSLGWWPRARSSQQQSSPPVQVQRGDERVTSKTQPAETTVMLTAKEKEKSNKRFGIDIGTAETSGFKADGGGASSGGPFAWFRKGKRRKKVHVDELPDMN